MLRLLRFCSAAMIDATSNGLRLRDSVAVWLASWPATIVFALLLFAATFRAGAPAGVDLDASWAMVLNWAHRHGVRWGETLIFSYGPLGYLQPLAVFDPELRTAFLVGRTLLGIGYALVFAATFRALGNVERVLFAALALVACRLQADMLLLGTAVLAVVVLDRAVRGSAAHRGWYVALAMLALLLNALALMKFTLFVTSALLMLTGVALLLREHRPLAAVIWWVLWCASLLVLWIGHGQRMGDLPAFVQSGFLLVAGYAPAMSIEPETAVVLVPGLLALMLAALVVLAGLRREPVTVRRALLWGYLAVCLFVCWRSTYTRADLWHVRNFFPLAAFVAFASLALGPLRLAARGRVAAAALTALCLAGVLLTALTGRAPRTETTADGAASGLHEHRAQQRDALRRQHDLPEFRRRIGDASVDVFGCGQSVLLLNGLRYAPRPVFQSYAAVSEPLLRINEAYYLGAGAPAFVVLGFCAIDRHAAASEDSLALLALLRAYRPVAVEQGYVLLQRESAPEARPLPGFAGIYRPVTPDEWIALPADDAPQRIHLRYRLSVLGQLRAWLLREPVLRLETQDADGVPRQFRLVRTTAQAGFLVSPQWLQAADYARWYADPAALPVRRLRVRFAEPNDALLFAPDIGVGFSPVALLRATDS